MKKLIIIIISIISFNSLFAQKYIDTYIKDANKIGMEWWEQVDNGEYEKAYNKLSKSLKDRFNLKSWLNQMIMLTDEIGDIQIRNIKETHFQSEIEGLEDGFYVTIEYDVKYSKTKNHTESILLKQNDKFIWEIVDFNYSFQSIEIKE